MVESVDTLDLKSSGQQCLCGFKSRSEYERNHYHTDSDFFVFSSYLYLYGNRHNLCYF